jgi:hypothetical protein
VIFASHALLAVKGFRPLGVLDRLAGKLMERLAETCGATPPEVCHRRFAAPFDDRGDAGEGQYILNALLAGPIRAQRTDQARGMDGPCPRQRRKPLNIRV